MARPVWRVLPEAGAANLSSLPGVPPILVQLLHNRGIRQPDEAAAFLSADSKCDGDPFCLPDMDRAVNRVHRALLAGEKIAIYGDFDADGITATALLVEGLSELGASVVPHIPDRFGEGYGVRAASLEQLRCQGASLVITCDCGISALEEIARAQGTGLDVIVTDHHVPLAALPRAHSVINPKRSDSAYPFPQLAGVGVAFKLLQAIAVGTGRPDLAEQTVDLVALGTVADMSPLLGENRCLVKRGIESLKATPRLGLQELMRCAGLEPAKVDAGCISWALAPRLNAAGRLDRAIPSYELLLTRIPDEAVSLARELERKNAERQRLTREVLERVRAKLTATAAEMPVLVVGEDDLPAGVVGIVAGKLAEEFYRPVFIVKTGAQTCRGSGRGIPEFNLVAALEECSDLLLEFGGHSGAAGFVVPTGNLGILQERLRDCAMRRLSGLDLRPHLVIDAEIPLSAMNWALYAMLQRMAPFGAGNPEPVFLSRAVRVLESRTMGGQGEHLRLRLRERDGTWQAVAFGMGDAEEGLSPYVDIVYTLELDRWGGRENLRLNLLDLAPAV